MSSKFNPKKYCGNDRVFQAVAGTNGIQRVWCWDREKKQYRPPVQGHTFIARRYEATSTGGRTRVRKNFATLEEARAWQRRLDDKPQAAAVAVPVPSPVVPVSLGPTFAEVYEAFWKKKVSRLSSGTQFNYQRYTALHFGAVMPVPVRAITPKFIDDLLDNWRDSIGKTHQSKQRTCFKHELSVLRSVLRFYDEYYDDPDFRFPLKERHARDAILRKSPPKDKDLTEEEFLRFVVELADRKYGNLLVAMATVQFYQALRISEVGALRFQDLRLDFRNPMESSLRICQHVIYPRVGKQRPFVEEGFKNARGGQESVKEQPLWPQTFEAFKDVFKVGATGLIFGLSSADPFSYRMIQDAYDEAFAKAGLTYTGTHVLRHGGTRRVYNSTGGDLAVAQQLLGNTDLASTLVYAQRDKRALRNIVRKDWEAKLARA